MKKYAFLISFIMILSLSACAKRSPEGQKQQAEANYTEEKTKTLQEYKKCVTESAGAADKLKICDALLKAVEATDGK
ncbi:MAG: hypothetical protein ACC653_13065 [Gammaproteobacteria bacterium]